MPSVFPTEFFLLLFLLLFDTHCSFFRSVSPPGTSRVFYSLHSVHRMYNCPLTIQSAGLYTASFSASLWKCTEENGSFNFNNAIRMCIYIWRCCVKYLFSSAWDASTSVYLIPMFLIPTSRLMKDKVFVLCILLYTVCLIRFFLLFFYIYIYSFLENIFAGKWTH